jgi:hypothetical protein
MQVKELDSDDVEVGDFDKSSAALPDSPVIYSRNQSMIDFYDSERSYTESESDDDYDDYDDEDSVL